MECLDLHLFPCFPSVYLLVPPYPYLDAAPFPKRLCYLFTRFLGPATRYVEHPLKFVLMGVEHLIELRDYLSPHFLGTFESSFESSLLPGKLNGLSVCAAPPKTQSAHRAILLQLRLVHPSLTLRTSSATTIHDLYPHPLKPGAALPLPWPSQGILAALRGLLAAVGYGRGLLLVIDGSHHWPDARRPTAPGGSLSGPVGFRAAVCLVHV